MKFARSGQTNARSGEWRLELVVLLAAAAAVTALFAATRLDVAVERLFYDPGTADRWPLAQRAVWAALYNAAPWITASLVVGGLVWLAVALVRRQRAWRRHAVFVLLCVVLGPGLLVNVVFKDHWGRPRPRDVAALGGSMQYTPAPLPGEGGASFPCGHCSVGFLYALGWWIWRRRRRRWAAASLGLGLVTGTMLGLGRMAAGAHFLSDVIWSALLAFGVAHVLYYYVLRIPAGEGPEPEAAAARRPLGRRELAGAVFAALGGVGVLLALFATPHGTRLATNIRLAALPAAPQALAIAARTASVDIDVVDSPADDISITGELHGFGLPTSKLRAYAHFTPGPLPTLHYRIEQRGWFTDLNGRVMIRVPAGMLRLISVRLGRGNIEVTDATAARVVESGRLRLDLETAAGRVRAPAAVHGSAGP